MIPPQPRQQTLSKKASLQKTTLPQKAYRQKTALPQKASRQKTTLPELPDIPEQISVRRFQNAA